MYTYILLFDIYIYIYIYIYMGTPDPQPQKCGKLVSLRVGLNYNI